MYNAFKKCCFVKLKSKIFKVLFLLTTTFAKMFVVANCSLKILTYLLVVQFVCFF